MVMAAGYSSGSDSASELRLAFSSSDRRSRKSPIGHYQPRQRIPSVEEVAKKEEPKWTVFSSSQNLAAALNDPMGREPDLFTRTWGGYFIPNASLPPSNLPSIELADFLRYLKETAPGRKSHRAIVRQMKKERKDSESSEASSPVAVMPLFRQLKQDGRMYDLSMVPRLFLQEDFSLVDPATFQEVLPLSQLLPRKKKKAAMEGGGGDTSPQPPNNRQTAKLLKEKLTHYLDVVEVHLAYQISQRSDLFFSTLSSQQEMQTYIMQVRHNVMELRHKLRQVDKCCTHGALKLFSLCNQRSHLHQVYQKLKLISTVHKTQPTIQLLLRTSDFVGALDLITTTQEVLQQELQGVQALRHLGSQLAELERAIEKMMEADFVHFALEDIRHRLGGHASVWKDGFQTFTAEGQGDSSEEEQLVSVVHGLLRQGKLHFLTALREKLHSFLKERVKEVVSDYVHVPCSEGDAEETPSLANQMRRLEFEAWLAMMEHIFDRVLLYLKAVQGSLKVIAGVCEKAAGKAPPIAMPTAVAEPEEDTSGGDVPVTFTTNTTTTAVEAENDLQPPQVVLRSRGGEEEMESFEADLLAQETEDRLTQLMLDDELSDARLGMGVEPDVDHSLLPHVESFTSSVAASQSGAADAANSLSLSVAKHSRNHSLSFETTKESSTAPQEELNRRGMKSVVLMTHEELTLDAKEKERLEDSLIIAGMDDNREIITATDCQRLLSECHEIMCSSCDLVHARCVKILNIRAKAGLLDDLASSEFVALVRLTENFMSRSVQITRRKCPSLRTALLSQAKKFLEHFHESRRSKLSLLLDGERWKQADVPAEIQTLVNKLEEGIPLPVPNNSQSMIAERLAGSTFQPPRKYLTVHGHNFAVVGIALLLIKVVVEYCQCADDLPVLVTEVLMKMIDMLKGFNNRTHELVLRAGAMESVGLKTITARHLALVTRCLQAIILLVPDMKAHFHRRLSTKQRVLLDQFDVVTSDLSSHCREINSKVMGIMDDMISKNLSTWEAKSPTPSLCFKSLVKQIVKLHNNLVDILPHQQLEALFGSIEQIFKSRLRMQLVRLGITNNGSTQHGIVNSELSHFKSALSSLENTTAFGSTLFDVWTVNR